MPRIKNIGKSWLLCAPRPLRRNLRRGATTRRMRARRHMTGKRRLRPGL